MWNNVYGYLMDSFIDWNGRIVPVFFVRGCNFRCKYCHNFEIAYGDISRLKPVLKEIISDDIFSKKEWYSGIVLSGGEVTILKDIVIWVEEIKSLFGLPIKIDTNGFKVEVIKKLLSLVDLFAVDIKTSWEKYNLVTGVNIGEIEISKIFSEIFSIAKEYPDKFVFRTTLFPFVTSQDIEEIRSYLPDGFQLNVQKFRKRGFYA